VAQTFTTEDTEDTEQRQGFNNDSSDIIEREGADIWDLTVPRAKLLRWHR
jgi:hypothetical protein